MVRVPSVSPKGEGRKKKKYIIKINMIDKKDFLVIEYGLYYFIHSLGERNRGWFI
jgi:hypothetical protein